MTDRPLPDLLRAGDGAVVDRAAWPRRRAELRTLFEAHVYGRAPGRLPGFAVRIAHRDPHALADRATRLELDVRLAVPPAPTVRLCVWIPTAARPVPAFLGLNFAGNHAVHPDPTISITATWVTHLPSLGLTGHAPLAAARGLMASRWPVEAIVARGYAVATAAYGDIEPDAPDTVAGLRAAVGGHRDATSWGAIGAWAWGLARLLDALETLPEIDARRVGVVGHSRLGKTALWAAASDERFALAWANNSGCTGAAVARGKPATAETVARLTTTFPHWCAPAYRRYADHEDDLPLDQHALLALIAPRPVYVSSAAEDAWADPTGEFLACVHADPVYRLLGAGGFGPTAPPTATLAVGDRIGYHLRPGPHDVMPIDWWHVLAFADRHLALP